MTSNTKSFKNAQELLSFAAKEMGKPLSAPIDVEAVAALAGARIVAIRNPSDHEEIGRISVDESGPLITVNTLQNLYSPRRRFTIAHELGHLCLHLKDGGCFSDDRKSMSRHGSFWNQNEYEANKFAAELLMPESMVLEYAENIVNNEKIDTAADLVRRLSEEFRVSATAMEYRLRNIGVLT